MKCNIMEVTVQQESKRPFCLKSHFLLWPERQEYKKRGIAALNNLFLRDFSLPEMFPLCVR